MRCRALPCVALPCCAVLRTYQVSYESTRYQGMYVHRKYNHKKSTPTLLSLASSTAQRCVVRCRALPCGTVPCRAVPCGAVLCRVLLCFLFRIYQTTTLASTQSWRETACPRALYTAVLSLHFPSFFDGLFCYAVPVYSNSSTVLCTSMLPLSIRAASTAKHSKAQHITGRVQTESKIEKETK